jgi:hypothetical protein
MCVYITYAMPGAERKPQKRGELRLEAISYHSKESWVSLRVYKIGSKEWGGYDETELIYSRDKALDVSLDVYPWTPF